MCSHYTDLQEYSKCMLQSYIEKVRHKFMADKNYSEQASHLVLDQLIDDITLEVVAEYHRAIVKGYADHVYPSKIEEKHESEALSRESESCNEQLEKKVEDIKCPNCTHPINASRFAPHLEKCMRIGRSSSRIASRRIASNSKDSNYAALSDDEDDEDWNSGNKKNKIIKKFEPKKKKDIKKSNKLLSRDYKSGKGDSRSKDECVDWLTSPKMQLSPISSSRLKKGVHDVDTEAEDTSTTPSPADSNSTSSGSASRRKDRVKSKRKVPKNYRYSEEPDSVILRG